MIIKTSSNKLLKTRNPFENCKIGRYRGKARHWEVKARVYMGSLEGWNT